LPRVGLALISESEGTAKNLQTLEIPLGGITGAYSSTCSTRTYFSITRRRAWRWREPCGNLRRRWGDRRKVDRALLKIRHRLAADPHSVRNQRIGLGDGVARIIDEMFRHDPPFGGVHVALLPREGTDLKLLNALPPLFEQCFGPARVFFLLDHSVVLRSKLILEFARFFPLDESSGREGERYDCHDEKNDIYGTHKHLRYCEAAARLPISDSLYFQQENGETRLVRPR
jgi:hypothetical protein